jgi:hypothetical protein
MEVISNAKVHCDGNPNPNPKLIASDIFPLSFFPAYSILSVRKITNQAHPT